jgi:phospholipase/carboxylesterase
MPVLDGPRLGPVAGGRPRQLVIILHGFDANGNAVFWLAHEWSRVLPHAAFVAPFAPGSTLFGGRHWFPLKVRSASERWNGVNMSAPELRAFIETELARHGLPESACALAGFSQGAYMALHVGLRWPRPFAGIAAYSGLLAGEEYLQAEIRSRPPVLLIHGDLDGVIPVQYMHQARDTLARCNVRVEWHVAHGLNHAIDRTGAAIGGRFLKSMLPA